MRKRDDRIGETCMANCGMEMTIIEYYTCMDIVVKFEDGYIRHTTYDTFKNGEVKNPNYKENKLNNSRIGETRIANCGMEMTIIKYNSARDMVVKFQDGYIKRTTYHWFSSGTVSNPNCKRKNKLSKQRNQECRGRYEGKSKIMNNGLSLKVLEYRDSMHMLCEWEADKSQIITTAFRFDKGSAKHPNYSALNTVKRSEYENQEFKTNDGHIAKVIQYNSYKNVIVILDNDYSKTYKTNIQALNAGKYFTNDRPCRLNHIGETYTNNQGIPYIVTNIDDDKGYIITFPDGAARRSNRYSSKSIKHPLINQNKKKPFNYHGISCNFIYSNKTDIYFACKCPKCGFEDILSAKEIVSIPHICE